MHNNTLIQLETYLELLYTEIKYLSKAEITLYTNICTKRTIVSITLTTDKGTKYRYETCYNKLTPITIPYIIKYLKRCINSEKHQYFNNNDYRRF